MTSTRTMVHDLHFNILYTLPPAFSMTSQQLARHSPLYVIGWYEVILQSMS